MPALTLDEVYGGSPSPTQPAARPARVLSLDEVYSQKPSGGMSWDQANAPRQVAQPDMRPHEDYLNWRKPKWDAGRTLAPHLDNTTGLNWYDKALDDYAMGRYDELRKRAAAGNAEATSLLKDPQLNAKIKMGFDKTLEIQMKGGDLARQASQQAMQQMTAGGAIDPSLIPQEEKAAQAEQRRIELGLPAEEAGHDKSGYAKAVGGLEHMQNVAAGSLFNTFSDIQGLVDPEAGSRSRSDINQTYLQNPKYQDSFWMTTMPGAAASMGSYAGAAFVGGPAAVAALGSAQTGGGMRIEAREAGASGVNEFLATMAGMGIGAAEALPFFEFSRAARRVAPKDWASRVKNFITDVALGGAGEASQEMASQGLGNLTKRLTFDPTQELTEGVGESGAAGFLLGGGMSAGASASGPMAERSQQRRVARAVERNFGDLAQQEPAVAPQSAPAPQAPITPQTPEIAPEASVAPNAGNVEVQVNPPEVQVTPTVAQPATVAEPELGSEAWAEKLIREATGQVDPVDQDGRPTGTLQERLRAREAADVAQPVVEPVQEPVPAEAVQPTPMTAAARSAQRPITPVTQPPPGRPGVLTPPQQPAPQVPQRGIVPIEQPAGRPGTLTPPRQEQAAFPAGQTPPEQLAAPVAEPSLSPMTKEGRKRRVKAPVAQPVEMFEAPQEAPAQTPTPKGAPVSAGVERLFSATLRNDTKSLTEAERKVLSEAKMNRPRQKELVDQAKAGDTDAAMTLVAAHMDNIKKVASMHAGKDSAKLDELVTVGIQTMQAALTGGERVGGGAKADKAKATTGFMSSIENWNPSNSPLGSFLVTNRNSMVHNAIQKAANAKSDEASLEGIAENAGKGISSVAGESKEMAPDEALIQKEAREQEQMVMEAIKSMIAKGMNIEQIATELAKKGGGKADPASIAQALMEGDFFKRAAKMSPSHAQAAYNAARQVLYDAAVLDSVPADTSGPVYVRVERVDAGDRKLMAYAKKLNDGIREAIASKPESSSGFSTAAPLILHRPETDNQHDVNDMTTDLFGRQTVFFKTPGSGVASGIHVTGAEDFVAVNSSDTAGEQAFGVAIHEVVHSLKETDNDLWVQLWDTLKDGAAENLLDEYVSAYRNKQKVKDELLDSGQATDEVLSSAVELAVYRQEFWREFYSKHPAAASRFWSLLKNAWGKIKRWFGNNKKAHADIDSTTASGIGAIMAEASSRAQGRMAARGAQVRKPSISFAAPQRTEAKAKKAVEDVAAEPAGSLKTGDPRLAQAGKSDKARAASRLGQEDTSPLAKLTKADIDNIAKGIFNNPTLREELWQKVMRGEVLAEGGETTAYKRHLLDYKVAEAEAGRVPWSEIVAAGAGYRISGTGAGRILAERHDDWQDPAARARDFGIQLITPPAAIVEEMKENLDIIKEEEAKAKEGKGEGEGEGAGAGKGAGEGGSQGAGAGPGQGAGQGAGQGPGAGAGLGPGNGPGAGAGLGPGNGPGPAPLSPRHAAALKALEDARREWAMKARVLRRKIRKQTGVDIAKLTPKQVNDLPLMIRLIRELEGAKADYGDMVYEYWINSLLSAVPTHIANAAAAVIDITMEYTIRQPIQMVLNEAWKKVTGNYVKGAPRFAELPHIKKVIKSAFGRGIRNAITALRSGGAVLEHQVKAGSSSGPFDNKIAGAIPGKAGLVLRSPSHVLMAVDEFYKGILYELNINALAARHLTDEKNLSPQYVNFQQELDGIVGDTSHPLHQQAVQEAERLTLQEPLGGIMRHVASARDISHKKGLFGMPGAAKDAKLFRQFGRMARRAALAKGASKKAASRWQKGVEAPLQIAKTFAMSPMDIAFHIPFLKTMINAIKRSFAHTPLATPMLLGHAIASAGKVSVGQAPTISGKEMMRKTSEQMIGWALAMILAGMDDDDLVQVIGSIPSSDYAGQRFAYQSGRPPSSLKVGSTAYDISRVDPMAGAVIMTKDLVDYMRERKKNPQDAFTHLSQKLLSQVIDKSFAKGLKNAYQSVQTEGGMGNWAAGHIASFVPNILKSIARGTDPLLREQGTQDLSPIEGAKKRLGYQAFPSEGNAPQPQVDTWGNDIKKDEESVLSRILSPFRARSAKGDKWSAAIAKFNDGTNNKYRPGKPQRTVTWTDEDGEEQEKILSDKEYYDYQKEAGRLAKAQLDELEADGTLTPSKLNREQIRIIEGVVNGARRSALSGIKERFMNGVLP